MKQIFFIFLFPFFALANNSIANDCQESFQEPLTETEKELVLYQISYSTPEQIIKILRSVSSRQIPSHSEFLKDIEQSLNKEIYSFDYNSLIQLLRVFKKLGLKPSEDFVNKWRNKMRKFRNIYENKNEAAKIKSLFFAIGIVYR